MSVAMLTSMLVTASPAMALSAPVVTTNNTGISQNGTWDIRFSVATAVSGAPAGNITITFPVGFTVNQSLGANISGLTIASGPGWLNSTTFGDALLTTTAANSTAATRQITLNISAGDIIGADAQVRIILPVGTVTNPSTPGSYTITVATSNETTPVTSGTVVITLPNIGPLPGQVEGKNSNGDVLYRNIVSDLSTVIATPGVSRIELSAGTYNATNMANVDRQTIIGVGAAGTVILTAGVASVPLTVSAVNVTIENVTIRGNVDGTADLLSVTGNNTNVKGVTFIGGVNQLNAAVVISNNRTTVSDCIFNVTGNVTAGIATTSRVTTNSTFNVDANGAAIVSTNGGALTVTANAKVNGTAGTGAGILMTGNASSTITGATFTGLGSNAVWNTGVVNSPSTNATGSSLTIKDSTFSGSGNSSTTEGVITNVVGDLILTNNTISSNAAAGYALQVTGGNVTARFNTIINTLNVRRSGGTANVTLNWWGAATGPASSTLSGTVLHDPHLTGASSSPTVLFNTANLTVAGLVDVTSSNGTMGTVGAARYAANPQTTAPTGTALAYFDVFISTPADGSTVTIKFFTNVNENSKVYYGGGLSGAWSLAGTQGVNVPGGYAYVQVGATSMPAFSDMIGTPFVVTTVVPPPAAPVLLGPAPERDNIPLNTGFSWSAVAGATYDFQVSTSPTFATTVADVKGLSSNVYGGVALTSNTTYFWRVRSMSGTPMQMSAWTVSTFTTAAPVSAGATTPPVINIAAPPPANVTVQAPPPASVTVQAPPPANVTVNPPAVTVQAPPPAQVTVNVPESVPAIPTSILWVIILIGAVLIISLIVLIVRTRRVA